MNKVDTFLILTLLAIIAGTNINIGLRSALILEHLERHLHD